ncbi:MAG: hypothetical protein WBO77_01575, partial [Microgenomates group bacterium]
RGEYLAAALSLGAAGILIFVAVHLHRLNDRDARYLHRREQLAQFLKEGESLHSRSNAEPLPIQDLDDWLARVQTYLNKEVDASYVVRFGNFSGMIFYGDSSPRSSYRNSVEGHCRRLNEFISEFSE